MSEQLRHKMFNFEAAPPPAVWEDITARLKDDQQYTAIATRLHNFEATVPPLTWSAIADRLNDDNNHSRIAKKMTAAETVPPRQVWEAIAGRLADDDEHHKLATKMEQFTSLPPASAWSNIAANLSAGEKEEAIPVTNQRSIFYRLAAAAIVATLVIGAWLLLNNRSGMHELVKTRVNVKPVQPVTQRPVTSSPANTVPEEEEGENESAIATIHHRDNSNHYTARAYLASLDDRQLRPSMVNNLPAFEHPSIVIHSSPILDASGRIINDMNELITHDYITVNGPNGQQTRISSKFANYIRYLSGDDSNVPMEYIEKAVLESNTWKKLFQEWRSKISKSTFVPSASNFLDIIEFKDLIQENK